MEEADSGDGYQSTASLDCPLSDEQLLAMTELQGSSANVCTTVRPLSLEPPPSKRVVMTRSTDRAVNAAHTSLDFIRTEVASQEVQPDNRRLEDQTRTRIQPSTGCSLTTKITKRARWKPNKEQVAVLELHFAAGHSKATPQLVAAVQLAGNATKDQVAVWLKNKHSRAKKSQKTVDSAVVTSTGLQNAMNLDHSDTRLSYQHHPVSSGFKEQWRRNHRVILQFDTVYKSLNTKNALQGLEDICKVSRHAIAEVSNGLLSIPPSNIQFLVSELTQTEKICCFGVGREQCVLEAFVLRLQQFGLQAHLVREAACPTVRENDLMVASAGTGSNNQVHTACLAALRCNAHVVVLTPFPTENIPFASSVLHIPSSHGLSSIGTMHETRSSYACLDSAPEITDATSFLRIDSLYETTLWMFFDIVCHYVREELGTSNNEMQVRSELLE